MATTATSFSSQSWRSVRVRHPLDGEAVVVDVHDRHTGHFADSSSEVAVARRDDVALVLKE